RTGRGPTSVTYPRMGPRSTVGNEKPGSLPTPRLLEPATPACEASGGNLAPSHSLSRSLTTSALTGDETRQTADEHRRILRRRIAPTGPEEVAPEMAQAASRPECHLLPVSARRGLSTVMTLIVSVEIPDDCRRGRKSVRRKS